MIAPVFMSGEAVGIDFNVRYRPFYTRTGPSGTLTAPDTPGAYEIWYIFGGSRELLENVAVTVN